MTQHPVNTEFWTPAAQAVYDRLFVAGRNLDRLVAFLAEPQPHDDVVVTLVQVFGALRQRDLCGLLGASRSTISRDVMHLREAGRLQEYTAQDTTTGRPTAWLTLPGGEPPSDGQRRVVADLVQDVLLVLPALLPPTVAAARTPTTVLERDPVGAAETTRLETLQPISMPPDGDAASAEPPPSALMATTSGGPPPILTERLHRAAPRFVPRYGPGAVTDRIRRLWAAFSQARRAHAARAAFRRVGIRAAAPHHRRNRVLVVGALIVIVAIGGALAVPARESWRSIGMPAWPLPVRLPSQPPTPALQHAQISGTGHLGLIVRDQPNGQRVGLLPEGAVVRILSGPRHIADARNPIWWEVMHKDVRGWVSARFLDLSMDS